jgi:hypothetical protein
MDPLITTVLTKAGASAIESAEKESAGFLKTVLGETGKGVASLIAVPLNTRLHANLIKAVVQAKHNLAAAGVTEKEVPLTIIHPMLQGASLEEDPSMQEIWGNMMANAADPRAPGFVEPSFSTILKDLTSREIKFLDAFVGKVRAAGGAHTFPNADVEFIGDALKESFDEAGLSTVPIAAQPRLPSSIPGEYAVESDRMGFYTCLDVLISHRLIEKHIRTIHHDALNAASGQEYETFSITALGISFVRACQPPQK